MSNPSVRAKIQMLLFSAIQDPRPQIWQVLRGGAILELQLGKVTPACISLPFLDSVEMGEQYPATPTTGIEE